MFFILENRYGIISGMYTSAKYYTVEKYRIKYSLLEITFIPEIKKQIVYIMEAA